MTRSPTAHTRRPALSSLLWIDYEHGSVRWQMSLWCAGISFRNQAATVALGAESLPVQFLPGPWRELHVRPGGASAFSLAQPRISAALSVWPQQRGFPAVS